MRRLSAIIVAGLFWASLSIAEEKRPTPAEEFLRQAPVKLENRAFGLKDRTECERFLAMAKQDERPPFLLVLARYYRVMEKRPVDALTIIGPAVVEPEKVAAWARANVQAEKEALAKWREEQRRARLEKWDSVPEKPAGPFAPFPPPTEWKISLTNS